MSPSLLSTLIHAMSTLCSRVLSTSCSSTSLTRRSYSTTISERPTQWKGWMVDRQRQTALGQGRALPCAWVVGAPTWLYPRTVASFLIPNHLAGSTGSLYREECSISSGERFVSFVNGYENKRTTFNIKAIKAAMIKSVEQHHFSGCLHVKCPARY